MLFIASATSASAQSANAGVTVTKKSRVHTAHTPKGHAYGYWKHHKRAVVKRTHTKVTTKVVTK
jgi:hypothetical protein